jgi:hypothetical protein
MSGTLVCNGCATTRPAHQDAKAQVTVRFVAPPEAAKVANSKADSAGLRLVSTDVSEGFATNSSPDLSSDAQHVVLWGGPFNGDNVTYEAAPLPPGAYMFGMFDPNQGAAYQGWIGVNNNGGDELFSVSYAELLMMPPSTNFLQPFTRPTFTEEELSLVRSGEAVTKVVLAADYGKAIERLRQFSNRRDQLGRTRSVLSEEVRRLENRRHYYRLTNHLYNHDKSFVENEQLLQDTLGKIAQVDQQTADHRRHCHALMYVAGLFSPGKSFDLFDQEVHSLQRDRAVFEEENRQIQQRFAQCGETSHKRIDLERDRQNVLAAIETIDTQIAQIGEARIALAKMRESSGVIHREGPAHILTASIIDGAVPIYLADAIERESLLTIRLQAADHPDSGSAKTVAVPQTTQITATAARD